MNQWGAVWPRETLNTPLSMSGEHGNLKKHLDLVQMQRLTGDFCAFHVVLLFLVVHHFVIICIYKRSLFRKHFHTTSRRVVPLPLYIWIVNSCLCYWNISLKPNQFHLYFLTVVYVVVSCEFSQILWESYLFGK